MFYPFTSSGGRYRLLQFIISVLFISSMACNQPPTETHADEKSSKSNPSEKTAPQNEGSVHVYSSRNEQLINPVFAAFTAETGIKVEVTTGDPGLLIQKLRAEGERTPASIFLTVDAGNLWFAKQQGLLEPVTSSELEQKIPAHLRDPEGHWFGFSIRARTLVYNTEKVKDGELTTYAALADPRWRDELLLRTSKKVYNQSLVAMLIAELGEEKTETIVKGWVANLAEQPFSNDTKLMEALAQGIGSVGIVNSYYYGRLMRKNPNLPIKLFWPGQNGTGVHVNVSGAGLIKGAPDAANGIKLLEWMASPKAQFTIAQQNLEYPADPTAEVDPAVAAWGSFQPSKLNLSKAGELQEAAIKLMDRAGYK